MFTEKLCDDGEELATILVLFFFIKYACNKILK
jgi:hypothetical protein